MKKKNDSLGIGQVTTPTARLRLGLCGSKCLSTDTHDELSFYRKNFKIEMKIGYKACLCLIKFCPI